MQLEQLEQLINLIKIFNGDNAPKAGTEKFSWLGKPVIVRHHMMGVNYGIVVEKDDKKIILRNSRKLWRWALKDTGVSLEDVAHKGLDPDTTRSKVSSLADYVEMPIDQHFCGIIMVSPEAEKTIISAPVAHQD